MSRQPAAFTAAQIIAQRLTQDPFEREDLVATALLGLVEYAHSRNLQVEEMLHTPQWKVLKCRAIDQKRRDLRNVRGKMHYLNSQPEGMYDSGPIRNRVDARRVLERAKLGQRDRAVLNGTYVRGHSLATVARQEGWSDPAARRGHLRLISRLRQAMEQQPHRNVPSDATRPWGEMLSDSVDGAPRSVDACVPTAV
ncbi:MAG: sigma-70 family RNA polymerase sigma factor [Myxococcales bacterium]|nr:sigma-70 family RNA polymerase sigma factor [Myxococcales bacterium]